MKFKLAYKSYPFSITLGACKRFTDATGLDLHPVMMDYINKFTLLNESPLLEKLTEMSKLYSRDTACHLFASIVDQDKDIPLEEFQDGTFRVSWIQSDRDDDLSEPWPMVILDLALQVNTYINENLHVKKKVIAE